MSSMITKGVRVLILDGFRDTQCGFKALRGDLARGGRKQHAALQLPAAETAVLGTALPAPLPKNIP